MHVWIGSGMSMKRQAHLNHGESIAKIVRAATAVSAKEWDCHSITGYGNYTRPSCFQKNGHFSFTNYGMIVTIFFIVNYFS